MDTVRKDERKGNDLLKNHKYTYLRLEILPFIKFVGLVKGYYWSSIVNYFDTKLTNGILEGINSKIQLAKRRARGFRNIKNFINMIRLICGKIKFNYPLKTL